MQIDHKNNKYNPQKQYNKKETEKQHVKKYKHEKLQLPTGKGKRNAET